MRDTYMRRIYFLLRKNFESIIVLELYLLRTRTYDWW